MLDGRRIEGHCRQSGVYRHDRRKVKNRDKNLIDKAKKDLHDVGKREELGERVDVGPRSWLSFSRVDYSKLQYVAGLKLLGIWS
jgi:hypothetical protein